MKRLRYVVLVGVVLLWLPVGATTGHRAGAQTAGWTWTQQPATGPSARYDAGMAYDAARGVTVLFGGGRGCGRYCGDTWTWDGRQWSQQQVSGPPAREGAGMAYDAVRGGTVLFGGYPCGGEFSSCGDTWTWDGGQWSPQQVSGPPARDYASMAYDAARGVTVLFGGGGCGDGDRDFCGDTWTWDGSQWSQQQVSGPPARYGAGMAYDAARGVTVLFGGIGDCGYCSDTWTWDGRQWSQQQVSGPPARDSASMAYDAARGVTVLFGGFRRGDPFFGDTWTWDGRQWSKQEVGGPPARYGAGMAYDAARGVTVLFGGSGGSGGCGGGCSDTWTWDGRQWSQQQAAGLGARFDASMAYDAARGVTVLFGGYSCGDTVGCGDTWTWDGRQWSQQQVSGPPARFAGSMAYDAARGVTVLFGGHCGSVDCGDTWTWDGREWSQQEVSGPPARGDASMAYDAARGVTVLFGGSGHCGGSSYCSDTWTWDGRQWSQQEVSGPPARAYASMAYDAARGVTVLFGGIGCSVYCGDSTFSDTWTWDGSQWSQRQVSGPPARFGDSMAYDAARGVTVLFGGSGCGEFSACGDTWTWDGRQWSQQQVSGPPARKFASMAYDAARGGTVLFGGSGGCGFDDCDDTWTLVGAPAAVASAAASSGLVSSPGVPFGVQATAVVPDSIR